MSGPSIVSYRSPKARIGLIIPSANTLAEPQLSRYAPEGVEIYASRYRLEIKKTVVDQLPDILVAASLLADSRPDLIVYHCTGMSMGSGKSAEEDTVAAIGRATGRPSTSTATAVVSAFRALSCTRVVLVTPYPQSFNDAETSFLGEHGVEVLADRALDLAIPEGMCGATPEAWIEATLSMRHENADAYFLSCTNIQSVAAIQELERRLERPVVTSNQAALWYALRRCGINTCVPELGELMNLSPNLQLTGAMADLSPVGCH